MPLPNPAAVGVRLRTGDLGGKGDILKLPGQPQASNATAFALPTTWSKPTVDTKGFPLTPSAAQPPGFLWLKPAGSSAMGFYRSRVGARPVGSARDPRHEVQQVLPVPGLLQPAQHGSGCPQWLHGPPPPAQHGACMASVPATASPPGCATPGSGTVAGGMSHALSPVSQNKYRRACLVGSRRCPAEIRGDQRHSLTWLPRVFSWDSPLLPQHVEFS